jgi:hypothetical protein
MRKSFISNTNFTRESKLNFLTKTHDLDNDYNQSDHVKIVRVSTILHHLLLNAAGKDTWSSLPIELVTYLVESSTIVSREDFTSYQCWNMFGKPVGWQFCPEKPYDEFINFPNVSLMINANRDKEGVIPMLKISHHFLNVTTISIIWLNGATKSLTSNFNYNTGRYILYYCEKQHVTHFGENLFGTSYMDSQFEFDSKFVSLQQENCSFFEKFPILKCNYEYEEKGLEELRKYFELFQKLLRGV